MPINERVVLQKMLKYCDDAMKYAQGSTYEDFIGNELYLTFSVFALSQLGELANRLDKAFYQKYPSIPWNAIRGLRNHIVHDYEGIEFQSLWSTITVNIPVLKTQLQNLLCTGVRNEADVMNTLHISEADIRSADDPEIE